MISEVGFDSNFQQGLDEGLVVGMSLQRGLDAGQVLLDLLDLHEGRSSELAQKAQRLVDGGDGLVVLSHFSLESVVINFSLVGFLSQGLSVVGDVLLELLQLVLESVSLGNEHVVIEVVGVEKL